MRRPLLLAAAALCRCAAASVRGDMAALESWCGDVTRGTYTTAWSGTNEHLGCAYAMGACACLTRTTSSSRIWRAASYACTFNPTVPAGVIGHLALVHSQWLGDRLRQLLPIGAGGCPWVGLQYRNESGAPAGWHHEPYQYQQVDYRTWAVRAADVDTPWAGRHPADGSAFGCLAGGSGKLRSQPDEQRYWICQYHYNFSLPRPSTFYTIKPSVDHWPVAAARINDARVRRHHTITDCTSLCAADWRCMGFAVNKHTAHCVMAYEVTDQSAVEAKPGYVLYERVYVR